MKNVLVTLCLMLVSFVALAEDKTVPNAYDHGLYLKMVEESELVSCDTGTCRYLVDGEILEGVEGIPNGISVVFPDGAFTVDQIEYYSPLINDYWKNYLAVVQQKVRQDCQSESFTVEQRQEMFCAELFGD